MWTKISVFGGLVLAAGTAVGAETYECLIEPMQVVEIRSPVEGLVEKIYVDRGDRVKRGQVLVQLESDVERSAVELARYRSGMEGRIAAARDHLDAAQKKAARWHELYSKKFVAAQARDDADAEVRQADAELREATENQQLAQREYRRAVDQLNQRILRSPFDGVVVDRLLNPGDLAESGTGRKPILKLAQIDPLRVEAVMPLRMYGSLKVGMPGEVKPEGLNGHYQAKIKAVDPVFDAASGTFRVRLEMPNRDDGPPAGVRCKVEFRGSATVAGANTASRD